MTINHQQPTVYQVNLG